MPTIRIDAGTLQFSATDLTATGVLVPFGVEARSNIGHFSATPESFTIPDDLLGMSLNVEHAREKVVGAFSQVATTDAGIVATFAFADTPAGRAAYADAKDGTRKNLSAEVADVQIENGVAVGGSLFAAALVKKPAFAGATLLAAADTSLADAPLADSTTAPQAEAVAQTVEPGETIPEPIVEETTETYTGDDGIDYVRTTRKVTDVYNGQTIVTETTTIKPATITPTDTPTESDTTQGDTMPAPATLTAAAHNPKPATAVDKTTFLGLVGRAMASQDSTLLAALADVKISGANSIGAAAIVPQYVGELWQGKRKERRVIPLLAHGDLTSTSVIGWKWTQEPEVSTWDGNKANVPTNTPTATPYNLGFQRFAGGWDIAREYIDFGQTEIIDALLQKAVDSYALKSDAYVLDQLLAAATSAPLGAMPAGDEYVQVPAIQKLVSGALRVIAAEDTPSWALIAPDMAEQIALVKKNNALEFLATATGLEEGSLAGFKFIPHSGLAAGSVVVGSAQAATVLELPGSPIRVDALDLVKGGVDKAVFGYITLKVDYPEGIQIVTDAA